MSDWTSFQDMPTEMLDQLIAADAQRVKWNKLETSEPYPKQIAFHAMGHAKRERLLMAANRFGKTESGAAEMAMHLTGRYPDWWQGKVFNGPIEAWAGGVTGLSTPYGASVPQGIPFAQGL